MQDQQRSPAQGESSLSNGGEVPGNGTVTGRASAGPTVDMVERQPGQGRRAVTQGRKLLEISWEGPRESQTHSPFHGDQVLYPAATCPPRTLTAPRIQGLGPDSPHSQLHPESHNGAASHLWLKGMAVSMADVLLSTTSLLQRHFPSLRLPPPTSSTFLKVLPLKQTALIK